VTSDISDVNKKSFTSYERKKAAPRETAFVSNAEMLGSGGESSLLNN
jgi:hypothetical protein